MTSTNVLRNGNGIAVPAVRGNEGTLQPGRSSAGPTAVVIRSARSVCVRAVRLRRKPSITLFPCARHDGSSTSRTSKVFVPVATERRATESGERDRDDVADDVVDGVGGLTTRGLDVVVERLESRRSSEKKDS